MKMRPMNRDEPDRLHTSWPSGISVCPEYIIIPTLLAMHFIFACKVPFYDVHLPAAEMGEQRSIGHINIRNHILSLV